MEQTTPEKPSATAKKLRKALKTAFTDTKFKVHVTHKVNLTVSWSDGPLENEVKEVTDKYNSNGYKGYEYEGTRYCGAKQIFLVRNETNMNTEVKPPWAQNVKVPEKEVEEIKQHIAENTIDLSIANAAKIEAETDPEDKALLEEWQAMTAPKQEAKTETVKSQGLYHVDIPVTKTNEPETKPEPTSFYETRAGVDQKVVERISAPKNERDLEYEINRYKTALEVVREIKTTDPDLIESIISQASLLAAEYFGIV